MTGFIAMQRDALDHPALYDAERFRAWFWLVANAAWKPTRTRIKGKIVTLERGQMTYSVRFLAEAWGWSKSRVDRFLSELRDEGMIETRSKIGTVTGRAAGQGQSIITICNYDRYQSCGNASRDNSGTDSGTTAGQQRDKEEQRNNNTPKKAHAIPANWWPEEFGEGSESRKVVARWDDAELARHVEQFKAHHTAAGNKYSNWQAAWSKWVLNSEKFKPRQAQQRGSSLADIGDDVRRMLNG